MKELSAKGNSIIENDIKNKNFYKFKKIFEFIINEFICSRKYKSKFSLNFVDTENLKLKDVIKLIKSQSES